jgi:hypothetical protein
VSKGCSLNRAFQGYVTFPEGRRHAGGEGKVCACGVQATVVGGNNERYSTDMTRLAEYNNGGETD